MNQIIIIKFKKKTLAKVIIAISLKLMHMYESIWPWYVTWTELYM